MKILFRVYNFFIFVQTFQWTLSEFLFNFKFYSRKSQSQEKLAKKITNFTIQFRLKNLTHFTNLSSLDIENNMLPQYSQKAFLTLKIFQDKCFCLVSEKTFTLQMSIYFYVSPQENFFSIDVVRFYLKGG